MRKFLTTGLLAATLALPGLPQGVQVTIDQQPLPLDQPPVMQDGRVLVPLRGIFEGLGAEVLYSAADRSIKATRGQTVVELRLGSRSALIDGQTRYLDVPAASVGGRTMVPLRFVSEALGAEVTWQGATRTVAITRPGGSTPPPAPEPPPPTVGRLEIQSVVHSATRPLAPGDRLEVVMTADPGGQAFFDVMGAFENVPMREVRPGRYEGQVTVPGDLDAEEGRLVARLAAPGGPESQMAARADVRFAVDSTTPDSGQLQPPANSTVNMPRPVIQVQYERPIRPETARVMVDNRDLTGLASVQPRQIRLVPNWDLAPGLHQVSVEAQETRGRQLRRQWTFTVSGAAANDGVRLTNLTEGQVVPRVFNVQGETFPGSQVRVSVIARGRPVEFVTQANNRGRFNARVDVGNQPPGTRLNTTVSVTDPTGRRLAPLQLILIAR